MNLRARTSIALLTAALGATGCKAWNVQEGPTPAEFVQTEHPERIQVRRTDNTTLELYNPTVAGDSLKGFPTELAIRPVTVPLTEIRSVATRHFSIAKSALLVATVAAGLFVYDWLMSLNQGI